MVPELMKDPVIMSKLAHIGLHSYGGYYANVDSAIINSKISFKHILDTQNGMRGGMDLMMERSVYTTTNLQVSALGICSNC
jgi:hypothetical protein